MDEGAEDMAENLYGGKARDILAMAGVEGRAWRVRAGAGPQAAAGRMRRPGGPSDRPRAVIGWSLLSALVPRILPQTVPHITPRHGETADGFLSRSRLARHTLERPVDSLETSPDISRRLVGMQRNPSSGGSSL